MKHLIFLFLLVSCGSKEIVTKQASQPLVSIQQITSPCSGILVSSGLDSNKDKSLNSLEITSAEIVCDGQNGLDGKNGADGIEGVNGRDGMDGVDGENGVDGKDGEDGADGVDGKSSIVSVKSVCENDQDVFGEILLVFDNGEVVGVFTDEFGARLIKIPYGITFRSSDESNCLFEL